VDALGAWDGVRAADPREPAAEPVAVGAGEAVLATWHTMLDAGRLQDGEAFLAGTAKRAVARVSAATAAAVGVPDGALLEVGTAAGSVVVPLVVTDMPDHVVWLPTNSPGCAVRATLRAGTGSVVRLAPARAAAAVQPSVAGDGWGVADTAGTHGEHHGEAAGRLTAYERHGHAAHDRQGLAGHDAEGRDPRSGGKS
jgi:NADH-quinone oxidoreductase subunit G